MKEHSSSVIELLVHEMIRGLWNYFVITSTPIRTKQIERKETFALSLAHQLGMSLLELTGIADN